MKTGTGDVKHPVFLHAYFLEHEMRQFILLQRERPAVFGSALKAEAAVQGDFRTACFYARRALGLQT